MGNCCGGTATLTATVPSEPEPAPQVTQRATPTPVLSQYSTEKSSVPSPAPPSRTRSRVASEPGSALRSPVPSSKPPSQTRSRAVSTSKPESTHHRNCRVSSQDSNPRSRKKSAPQPLQSSKSSSPQKTRTRAETLSAPKGSSRSGSRPTGSEHSKSRLPVASKVSLIEISIESERCKYWRNLWSSPFTDKRLKDCVELIHNDIVAKWDQDDSRCPGVSTAQRNQYLSSDRFKIYMSHVVKDPAVPADDTAASSDWNASGDQFAVWVYDMYKGTKQENVQCVMGYIVNLIVILDEMLRTAASNVVTEDIALMVMETYIRSGRRDRVHQDIRRFVTETFPNRFANPQKDLVLEKIIDLIRQYCTPPFRE